MKKTSTTFLCLSMILLNCLIFSCVNENHPKKSNSLFQIHYHSKKNWPKNVSELISFDYNHDKKMDFFLVPLELSKQIKGSEKHVSLFPILNSGKGVLKHDKELMIENNQFVHIRHWQTVDLNNNGHKDLLITDHGTDKPPFQGGYSKAYTIKGKQLINLNLPLPKMFTFHICATLEKDGPLLYVSNLDAGDISTKKTGDSVPPFFLKKINSVWTKMIYSLPATYRNFVQEGLACSLVDMNKDGLADLVLGSNDGSGHTARDHLLLQSTDKKFKIENPNSFPIRSKTKEHWGTSSIDVADLNNDGNLDTLHLSHNKSFTRGKLQVFINDGKNKFQEIPLSNNDDQFDFYWYHWLKTADLNKDGWLDIILLPKPTRNLNLASTNKSKLINHSLVIYINEKNNTFKRHDINKEELNNHYFVGFSIIDYDEDDDLDIIGFTYGAGYYLLENIIK